MPRHTATKWTVGLLVCVVGSVVAALAAPAAAKAAAVVPYSLQVSVLTGPQGGLLRIEVPHAGATVPAVTGLKYVQVSVNGQLTLCVEQRLRAQWSRGDRARASPARGDRERKVLRARLAKQALVQLGRATIARLRPDLVVAGRAGTTADAPRRGRSTWSRMSPSSTGTSGATAILRLMLGPTLLAEPKTVTVPPGGRRLGLSPRR